MRELEENDLRRNRERDAEIDELDDSEHPALGDDNATQRSDSRSQQEPQMGRHDVISLGAGTVLRSEISSPQVNVMMSGATNPSGRPPTRIARIRAANLLNRYDAVEEEPNEGTE